MAGDFLTNLTLITTFLCLAISLWFAIYLLARSPADPLTFRAVIALLGLAYYYNNAFSDMLSAKSDTGLERSFATLIILIVSHNLTHYLLSHDQQKKVFWAERVVVLIGGIAILLLFTAPSTADCDPRYTCPATIVYPWIVIDLFKVLIFFAILYNLWLIKKSLVRLQNLAFYEALLLGISTIAYSLVGTALNLDLPRFISNLTMLAALALLLYSVARDRIFITRRSSPYDLPITLLTITVIVVLYVISAYQIGLRDVGVVLIAVLAIFTHSAYDFVREFIDRMFRAQEGRMRQELRRMARDTSSGDVLPRFLKRGLAILCHNLRASNGLIAMHHRDHYQVVASLHCLSVGTQIDVHAFPLDLTTGCSIDLMGYKLWIVPAFVGPQLVAVVGLGTHKKQIPYTEEDLYWLEDIAEEIGQVIGKYWKEEAVEYGTSTEPVLQIHPELQETLDEIDTGELLSRLAYRPDPEMVKCVEEGLRNLNDYSRLGKSTLVSLFALQTQDHIESGKLVQQKLTEIIEKLRPPGKLPNEPIPREWYAYTILHDAYVENRLAREIMAKLYISEGTYYRMRRHALRGVTRVLLELGTIV